MNFSTIYYEKTIGNAVENLTFSSSATPRAIIWIAKKMVGNAVGNLTFSSSATPRAII